MTSKEIESCVIEDTASFEWCDRTSAGNGPSKTLTSTKLKVKATNGVINRFIFRLIFKKDSDTDSETEKKASSTFIKPKPTCKIQIILSVEEPLFSKISLETKLFKCDVNGKKKNIGVFKGTVSDPLNKSCNLVWTRDHELKHKDQFTNSMDISVQFSIRFHEPSNLTKLYDQEPTMWSTLKSLCMSEELSDIKILCDGTEFPCHKFVLSARSDVFKAMFLSNVEEENPDKPLTIEDISSDTMKTLLKFLYCDELEVQDINCPLLMAADKYNIKRLVNICSSHLSKTITTENVMNITVAAYLLNNERLMKEASEFIFNHRGTIQKSEEWDDIKQKHPGIVAKVMDTIVFDTSKI